MTPKEIVREVDKYIVGQHAAKRAVAIALRNRWRRQQLPPDLREEIAPKNIIMIGPTGVGKTEIARRLARLTRSPFLKIEASKFTEVGYVGRDVESIVRDLTEIAVKLVKDEKTRLNRETAERNTRERILDLLLPDSRRPAARPAFVGAPEEQPPTETREKLGVWLDEGRLDELDKIAGRQSASGGPDVSREGVQRDLLPIVEGTTVNTKYGMVKTDHILFIAAGAFHVSKPSDLIPELQGRFPIRVELESLTIEDFKRILTEPKNALIKQYRALLETEGVELEFTEDAIEAIANFAARVNEQTEDIGARRLHTIMEKLLDVISFEGPDLEPKNQRIDAAYVTLMLFETVKDQDLSRYIL